MKRTGGHDSAVLVHPSQIEVHDTAIAAVPLVNQVLDRLGLDELVAAYLPEPDPRSAIEPARVIGVLVRNLAISRQPLYAISAWAARYEPGLLGLRPGEPGRLNDDRVGRALDTLFLSDRASLLTELSIATIRRFSIDVSELHNDSTSITLYGAYRGATGTPRAGRRPPVPERGFSKDHRGDLLQLVEILSVSADGTVPVAHRLADGSTEDSTTHIDTWNTLAAIVGGPGFTYVADCKLATRDNMDHIAGQGGRFLTILARTRKEDQVGRAWIAAGQVAWEEIFRHPGKKKHDPPDIYWAAEAPSPSAEGYRICWIRSSQKRDRDAAVRADRIERARAALAELEVRLSSPRCQMRSTAAVEDAAHCIIAAGGATRWVRAEVAETIEVTHRQERKGRPGKDTRYRQIEHRRFSLTVTVDAEAVGRRRAKRRLLSLRHQRGPAPSRAAAHIQGPAAPERRHATFKGVIEAAPLTLKSDTRIDALGSCLYVALLVHALVERQLRQAMAANRIASLPLYYEERACATPTAARVFELLEPLCSTTIFHAGEPLAISAPTLDPLQRQILSLLKVPTSAYRPAALPAKP